MKHVAMIGIGPGNASLLTADARQKIEEAEVLIGAERAVAPFSEGKKETVLTNKNDEIAAFILGTKYTKIAVLFTGDVTFYSGASKLKTMLSGVKMTYHCGVSSFHYFCSLLQIPSQDVYPISFRGRMPDLAAAVRRHKRVFALTGSNAADLCRDLCRYGFGDVTVHIGENLSYETQHIYTGTAYAAKDLVFSPLSVMIIENKNARNALKIGLPDDNFVRGDVPMTKQEARCVSLSKLDLHREAVCWDVGAGTGSVSVELAFAAKSVYAIERNPEAIALIRQNQERFGLSNITVIEGPAPESLESLPAPDCVFIGGSGGKLAEILSIIFWKNPKAKVVLNITSLETLSQLTELCHRLPISDFQLLQLQSSRGKQMGAHMVMQGQNPVFIVSFKGNPNG